MEKQIERASYDNGSGKEIPPIGRQPDGLSLVELREMHFLNLSRATIVPIPDHLGRVTSWRSDDLLHSDDPILVAIPGRAWTI